MVERSDNITMSTERADVIAVTNAVSAKLSPLNFTKKGNSWYCRCDDMTVVFQMQKSLYSPRFYLNVGVFLAPDTTGKFLPEHKADVRFRVSSVLDTVQSKNIEEIFDFDNQERSDSRLDDVVTMLDTVLVPLIENLVSLPMLVRFLKLDRVAEVALVTADGRKILESLNS